MLIPRLILSAMLPIGICIACLCMGKHTHKVAVHMYIIGQRKV